MKTVDWVTWGKAALIRGVRTFAEAMLAYIGTGALVLGDVNWVAALGCAAQGGRVSIDLEFFVKLVAVTGIGGDFCNIFSSVGGKKLLQ